MRRRTIEFLVLILMVLPFSLLAQPSMDILTVQGVSSVEQVPAGESFFIALRINVKPEFHINSNQPLDPSFIPTNVSFEPKKGVSFGKVRYPEAERKKFAFSTKELAIFEGSFNVFSEVTLKPDIAPGVLTLKGTLSYQACNDQNCFMPQATTFEIPVKVVPAGGQRIEANTELFQNMPVEGAVPPPANDELELTKDEQRAKEVIEKGMIYAIAAFFVFGLALNLTPCVYPVIPITVSYFGGQADRRKGQAFGRATAYVIGIAIIFALLGLVSGLAGKQWGFLFQNPWFVVVVTVIILAMAASMFGAFEIQLPASIMNRFGQAREGTIGAFIMGLTVGVVIAPCAAGIIIGLVGLVAKLGIVVKGTILFFVMGLGLGLPYLILATFSGLLNRLPQSGMWMVWIRKLFGVLLIGVALYFFLPQAKHMENMQGYFFGLLAIFGGLLLGFLDHAPGYTRGFKIGRGVFGVLLILLGISWVHGAVHYKPPEIAWKHYTNESIEKLVQDGKPVFIDFYADWCAPCKEMDRNTFPDPAVVELAREFTMVKVDCTSPDNNVRHFMNQFQVTGMPTLVFLLPDGREMRELREIGFVDPVTFARKMKEVLKNTE